MPDLTVGMKWRYTLAACETPGKYFQGPKVKPKKKEEVEKKASYLPQVRPPPLWHYLMLFGASHTVYLTERVRQGQRTGQGEVRRCKGPGFLILNHKCIKKLLK